MAWIAGPPIFKRVMARRTRNFSGMIPRRKRSRPGGRAARAYSWTVVFSRRGDFRTAGRELAFRTTSPLATPGVHVFSYTRIRDPSGDFVALSRVVILA